MFRLIRNHGGIMTRKWIESLLDDMVESQWSKDIIKQEYDRFSKGKTKELNSIEDLEPINQYSSSELADSDNIENDFNSQVEYYSKRDYEDYLISQATENIRKDDYLDEFEFDDEYLEGLIKQHLEEEKDFLDMVVKEAIAEDDYFQDYVERRLEEYHTPDFPENPLYLHDYQDSVDYYMEDPVEKEVFDDLGDTSYMDQGIYEGANTDSLEEPFEYVYYEESYPYDDLPDRFEDYDRLDEDIGESKEEMYDRLIEEKLFEEKYLDKIFVEIIKKEDKFDKIIAEKLANDIRLNESIDKYLK